MTIADRSQVDLRDVLRTTCAASPAEAIDVMADGLATLTGGRVFDGTKSLTQAFRAVRGYN